MEQPAPRTRKITPGKTILIKSDKKYESTDYAGIKTITVSKTGSQFVLFDTIENAETAMGALLAENVYSKYLQYHLFFKLVNRDTDASYEDIKKNMIEKINHFDPHSKVLYYRLKRKNDQLTGCGDFVVDSYETQQKLLTAKKLDLGEGVEATFTPFINIRRNQFRQRNNRQHQNNTSAAPTVSNQD